MARPYPAIRVRGFDGCCVGVALLILLFASPPLLAQPPADWLPVDQNVADLDELTLSLRKVQVGLNANGEQTSLFEVRRPLVEGQEEVSTFYRLAPGFRARVKRMDYLVPLPSQRRWALNVPAEIDGMFIDIPGADWVWELSPNPDLPTTQPLTLSPALVQARREFPLLAPPPDARLDARIDSRLDGRMESR